VHCTPLKLGSPPRHDLPLLFGGTIDSRLPAHASCLRGPDSTKKASRVATYKNVVKVTFAKGAALQDPSSLFKSSLEGNVRRAIAVHEGDKVDETALKDLIRAAVALNLKGKSKPKPRRARKI